MFRSAESSTVSKLGNGGAEGRRMPELSRKDRASHLLGERQDRTSHPLSERQERAVNRWVLPLVSTTLLSMFLFCCVTFAILSTGRDFHQIPTSGVLEGIHHPERPNNLIEEPNTDRPPKPPVLAYLISGSVGSGEQMLRLTQALYHPRNEYLLHMDLESPVRERVDLARSIALDKTYKEVNNVHIVAKANLVTYRGPTMVSTTLHGMAILLRKRRDWDWFINLSAGDYPCIPQDDLLHVFSYLPRDLNFIEHSKNLGWKENGRAKPIMLDPGIYSTKKADVFFVTQRRPTPTSFKLFTGSAWMVLSRQFCEYLIYGYDNLPRLLLMYYTNFVSSPEGYFHTVICNAPEFKNTTVNTDMHFITWHRPARQHPQDINMNFWPNVTDGIPFARKFPKKSDVIERLDKEILHRKPGQFTPGGWCVGPKDGDEDPCSVRGDPTVLRPGLMAKKLEGLVSRLLDPATFRARQCT